MRFLVIGGGPAGLATAIHAVRGGTSAVVFDERTLPLDKACGEGIQPSGVRLLAEMGVEIPEWGRCPLAGIRYVDGDVVAEGRFSSGAGLGVRRTALVEALSHRAREMGASLRYGVGVRAWETTRAGVRVECADGEIVEGDFLVGADGLKSRVREKAGLSRVSGRRARFGARRHFAMTPWSSFVEVHWSRGAEAYVTPAGADRVGVALLWSGAGERWDTVLARFPTLVARLEGAPAASALKGAGPFDQPVRRRYTGERLALVGDAAGYLDPLTGEGLTLGLASARALAETVIQGRSLSAYEAEYRRLSRNYYLMTRLVLLLSHRPRLRGWVVRTLARHPRLFEELLAVNAGERSIDRPLWTLVLDSFCRSHDLDRHPSHGNGAGDRFRPGLY